MKNKLFHLLLSLSVIIGGCKKINFDESVKGEALGTFNLTTPDNNAILVLNSATPNAQINITWAAAKPGVSTAPTYTFIAALKTGSLTQPLLEVPADNNGKSNKLTLTQKQLDDLLKAKNVAEGTKTDLIWNVRADNGSKKEMAGTSYNIAITRFGDGISNFLLYGPVSSPTSIVVNPNSTVDLFTFKWQKAFPGKSANPTTYKLKLVAEGGSFDAPIYEVASNNAGLDSTFTISHQALDLLLTSKGFTDQAAPAKLQWTVEATSGNVKKYADYVNDLSIIREVNLFMVGSASEHQWDNGNPTYMFRDLANSNLYTYTGYLQSGEFKFITTVGSWNTQYGSNGSGGVAVKPQSADPDPGTFQVTTAGYYTVKIDIKALTFSMVAYNASSATVYASIGIIGGFNGWGDINAMTKTTFNPHIWQVTQRFDQDSELKFRIATGWDVNWGTSAADVNRKYGVGVRDGSNLFVKTGNYKIFFNDLTSEYIFYNQ